MKKNCNCIVSIAIFIVAYLISSYSLIELDRYVKKTFSFGLQNEVFKIFVYLILSMIVFAVLKIWLDSVKNPKKVLVCFCIIAFILGLFILLPYKLFQPLSSLMIIYSGAIASYLIINKFKTEDKP